MSGFIDFIRNQGVVGLAVGFALGGAVSKVVASLVTDVINPLLSVLFLGANGKLKEASVTVGDAQVIWGSFLTAIIDFTIIAIVIYYGVKLLGLDRLYKK